MDSVMQEVNNLSVDGVEDLEDPNPYPLWSRSPTTGTMLEEAPHTSSLSGEVTSFSLASSPTANHNEAPLGALPGRERAPCQYPACPRYASYGARDATPIACKVHKRTGHFTLNRHGVLLVATRDGRAFRASAVTATGCPPGSNIEGADGAEQKSWSASSRVQDANWCSTSMQGLRRKNRPGLLVGSQDSTKASQHGPCLFPGCDARPDYGLPGAIRAVYCSSHKKPSMVHTLKNSQHPREREEFGGSTEARTGRRDSNAEARMVTFAEMATGNRKNRPASATAHKSGSKKSWHTSYSGGQQKSKKIRGDRTRSAVVEHNIVTGGLTTSNRKESSRIGRNGSFVDAAAAHGPNLPPSPPSEQAMVVSGMTPSAEMLVVRQAREAAKKEAEASQSGKRPRAPSRRALEASGQLLDEGAQWMTREKKAEEERVKKEINERRKQSKAAGLKFGVVYEACGTAETSASAESAVRDGTAYYV